MRPGYFALLLTLSLSIPVRAAGVISLPSLDNPLKEATQAFGEGDYKGTVELLTRYLAGSPRDADAYIRRGIAYSKLKQNKQAGKDFDSAKTLAPDSPKVALVRGAFLYETAQYQESLADLEMAITGFPQDHFPVVLLSCSYYHLSQYEKSLTMAKKALAQGYNADEGLSLMMVSCLGELKHFKEAGELLAQLCEKPGASADVWIARGNWAGYQEKINEAVGYYQKALQTQPDNADALYHLAICRLATNKSEAGLKELSAAVAAAPKAVKLRLFKAELLFKLKRYDEAIADYKILEELAPDNFKVFRGEAAALALSGRYQEVLAKAERACQIKPDDAPSQLLRATCLAAYNRFDDALAAYDLAVESGNGEAQYYLARAKFYAARKKYKESLQDFDLGLKQGQETDEELTDRLLPLIELGLNERALKDVNTLAAHGYHGSWLYLVRGTANASRGNYKASIDDLQKFAAKNPDAPGVHKMLTKIYMSAGDFNQAVQSATTTLTLTPADDETRKVRAAAYFCAHDFNGALEDCRFLLSKNGDDESLLELAGFSSMGLGLHQVGMAYFRKIIATYPESYNGYAYLALAQADRGLYGPAHDNLTTALAKAPDKPSLYLERAKVAYELGVKELAYADLAKSLELQPTYTDALDKRASFYLNDQDYPDARADLNQILQIKPTDYRTYLRLAEIDDRLAHYDDAKADRKKFWQMDLTEEQDLLDRATYLKENGMVALALKDAFKAIDLYPHSSRALYLVSDLFEMTDSQKEVAYLTSLKHNPRFNSLDKQIDYCLSAYYEQKRQYGKALSYLKSSSGTDDLAKKIETQRGVILYRQGKYKAAVSQFDACIKDDATVYANYLWRGRVKKAQKNLEGALADFDLALLKEPLARDAYKARALTLSQLNRPKAALACVELALTHYPDSQELLEYKAFYQTDCGLYKAAIETYDLAIAKNPGAAALYLDRGIAHIYLDQYKQGISDCSMVLALDPDKWEARVNLGTCYKALGDYEQAISCYKGALAANPAWHSTYSALANSQFLAGQYEQAIKNYTTALKYNPRSQMLYINRGSARGASGDYKGLLADTTYAHKLGKPTAVSLKNISLAMSKLGQKDNAADKLRLVIQDEPASASHYISLAALLTQKIPVSSQNLAGALVELDRAIALDAKNPVAIYKKTRVLSMLGKKDQALEIADAYLKDDPDNGAMLAARAEILIDMDRAGEALSSIQKIKDRSSLDALDIDLLTLKGMALTSHGQYESARESLDSAVKINARDRAPLIARAKLKIKTADLIGAISDLSSAIALDDDNAMDYAMRSICYSATGNVKKARQDELKARSLTTVAIDMIELKASLKVH